jgi:hypothetical protein
VECLNFIIRACLSIPEIRLLKQALKILAYTYMYFQEIPFAVSTLERLRDVAVEDLDQACVIGAYKQMGLCFQK